MSFTKIFFIVIFIVIVVIGGFFFFNQDTPESAPVVLNPQIVEKPDPLYDTATPPEKMTDRDIVADLSAVEKQTTDLGNDFKKIDSAMNDKPVVVE